MDRYYRPTRAEIDMDALSDNIQAFRTALGPKKRLLASVKANAYGHGAVEIAREAERLGLDYLGVAFLDEGLQLRAAGVKLPILVLGYVPVEGLELARANDLTIALFRQDVLEAAQALADKKDAMPLKVHIKVDTGMGRLGIVGHAEALTFIEQALGCSGLYVEGLFTHFSCADERDKTYTQKQHERFSAIADEVTRRGWDIPIVHAANSAAGIDSPEWAGDMVRLGIGMYGLYPSIEVNRQHITLKPVLSLKTQIVMVKQTPADWGISYGAVYRTQSEEWIGTLPIGYADGYSRLLTGKVFGLVRGQRQPIRGTICMDQCMISLDFTDKKAVIPFVDEPELLVGDEVVLIGCQGDERITVDELADQMGTIHYELLCMLTARVPKVYVRQGNIIAVHNALGTII